MIFFDFVIWNAYFILTNIYLNIIILVTMVTLIISLTKGSLNEWSIPRQNQPNINCSWAQGTGSCTDFSQYGTWVFAHAGKSVSDVEQNRNWNRDLQKTLRINLRRYNTHCRTSVWLHHKRIDWSKCISFLKTDARSSIKTSQPWLRMNIRSW
jgi:hypothetical protein